MPVHPPSNIKKDPAARKAAWVKYDSTRPNSSERGYDGAWQVVRKHHLQNNPLCHDCLHNFLFIPAVHVHHIKKLKDHPELRDDPNNLMSLCESCHNIRTARGE